MQPQLTLIASGLQFPEGPIALSDGSIVLVQIKAGQLTHIKDGETRCIAELGGGPNGAAMGPDGFCYVCNNGGMRFHEKKGLLFKYIHCSNSGSILNLSAAAKVAGAATATAEATTATAMAAATTAAAPRI